jgi:hypothetical protein
VLPSLQAEQGGWSRKTTDGVLASWVLTAIPEIIFAEGPANAKIVRRISAWPVCDGLDRDTILRSRVNPFNSTLLPTRMKRPLLLPLLALLSLVQTLPQAAGQAPTPGPSAGLADPAVLPPSPSPQEAVQPVFRVALDFQQATAGEIAEYLTHKSMEPVSILFIGGSENTRLPSMKLRNVTVEEFVLILNQLGNIEAEQGGAGYQLKPVPGVTGIYTFQNINPLPALPSGKTGLPNESAFYDLSSILDGKLTVADVTTALSTAWATSGEGVPSRDALKFHEESNLLIVTGTPAQLSSSATLIKLLQDRKQTALRDKASVEIANLRRTIESADEARARVHLELEEVQKQARTQLAQSNERIFQLEIELARLKAAGAKPRQHPTKPLPARVL